MRNYLFTTFYVSIDEERNKENLICLERNCQLDLIDKIFLVLQDEKQPIINNVEHSKIEYIHLGKRPKFSDFFDITNKINDENIRFIIANSDIYFDHTLSLMDRINLKNTMITLTRWDLQYDNSLKFYNKYLSQDTWIYSGAVNSEIGSYFIGQHGCDNKLLYELNEIGYKIINPSLSVKSIHVHMSQLRPYFNDPNYKFVDPPYKYSLPAGIIHPFTFLFSGSKTKNDFGFCLVDYYYIRFEYFWFIFRNRLQKVHSNIFIRLLSIPLILHYFVLFKIAKRISLKAKG